MTVMEYTSQLQDMWPLRGIRVNYRIYVTVTGPLYAVLDTLTP